MTSGLSVTDCPRSPTDAAAVAGAEPSRRWFGRRPGRQAQPPRSARLRLKRRRMLLVSTPFVVLLLLAAARLISLNLVHAQTLDAYRAGDKAHTLSWGERQGWVNIVEQFRSPFAIGDAHVLSGHYDLARPWFEQAFEQVPKGGVDECKVRVNLGLTYERLGDAAKARERTAEWKQFYDKGITITKERPPLCDAPEQGEDTGQALQDAQQRMEQKNGGDPQPTPPEPQPGPTQPQPQPTPDPDDAPSERQQQQLQEQQKQNTIERNQRNNGTDDSPGGGSPQPYPKPW